MSNKLGIFLAGGAVGAIIALLYAPRTGEETRALIADKANDAWGQAREVGAEAQQRGQRLYNNVTAQGKAAYETVSANAAQAYGAVSSTAQHAYAAASTGAKNVANAVQTRVSEAYENAKPGIEARNEELREKIESARQRIASQVAKNAGESAEEPLAVEAEEVETTEEAAE